MKSSQLTGPPREGGFVKRVEFTELEGIDWDVYPFNIAAVKCLPTVNLQNPITILVGENGSGKSTIIEALAQVIGLNPEGGSKNFNFRTAQTHSVLENHLRAVRTSPFRESWAYFLRAESMYNVFSQYEEYDYPGDKLPVELKGTGVYHTQSHGESFFKLMQTQFREDGIYVLDEPESALSPQRQLETIALLHNLAFKKRSQIFLATHSPILAAIPGATIFQLDETGIVETPYEDTELYRTYSAFFKSPKSFLRYFAPD